MSQPTAPPRNAPAIAALILGITGLVLSPVVIGALFGIIGLVLGIIALSRPQRRGMAITGIVTGGLAPFASGVAVIAWALILRIESHARVARADATEATISMLQTALDTFEVDTGRYPTTEEGLEPLVSSPADLAGTWRGPYLRAIPLDGWTRPFRYRRPSTRPGLSYDLWSTGPSGTDGGPDNITNPE